MNDSADIHVCIAFESTESLASSSVIQFERSLALLRQMPVMDASRLRFGMALWALIHRNHVVYYVQQARAVVILRVLHGARDVQATGGAGGFSVQ